MSYYLHTIQIQYTYGTFSIVSHMKVETKIDKNRELATMNALQVKNCINRSTTAIIVMGACENHGDHMPFGADFIFPTELLKRIAVKLRNVIILPSLPYGLSSHHGDFQMTISLQSGTVVRIIQDICQSLIKNGIKRILIINGHDGNIAPIEIASRFVKSRHPEVVIACLEAWWALVGQSRHNLFDVWDGLGHGGEAETSAMLAVRPDLVKMNNAPKVMIPKLPTKVRIYWKFNELSDTGTTGAPRKATAEKGYEIVDILEDILISFLNDMDRNRWKYGISHKH
jgi:creatinine amidohydrolase